MSGQEFHRDLLSFRELVIDGARCVPSRKVVFDISAELVIVLGNEAYIFSLGASIFLY